MNKELCPHKCENKDRYCISCWNYSEFKIMKANLTEREKLAIVLDLLIEFPKQLKKIEAILSNNTYGKKKK